MPTMCLYCIVGVDSLIAIIDLAAVSSVDDSDNQLAVIDGVDDAIGTGTQAEQVGMAFQLFDITNIWQSVNRFQNANLLYSRVCRQEHHPEAVRFVLYHS